MLYACITDGRGEMKLHDWTRTAGRLGKGGHGHRQDVTLTEKNRWVRTLPDCIENAQITRLSLIHI